VPRLSDPLHDIDHPLIRKAQALPGEVNSGGAERILALSDRIWYKVKVNRYRGAAIFLEIAAVPETASEWRWWLCAAGIREDGARTDFYAAIEDEARRQGSRRSPSSSHLLPAAWDWERLSVELVVRWQSELKRIVVNAIAASIEDGLAHTEEFDHYRLSALVHAEEGEAYLSLSAQGFADPKIIAIILSSVPGVPRDFWQDEPNDADGVPRKYGELMWSTLLPSSAIAEIRQAATS
jgi:hypothetical protein